MWRKSTWMLLAFLAMGMVGCGGSDESETKSKAKKEKKGGPAEVVKVFLEATRNGEDEDKLMPLLTSKARKVMADLDVPLSPRANDMAKYSIGKVEFPKEGAAQVVSTLTDLTDNSQKDIMWMLRQEPDGWRIAGLALVINGKLGKSLNFENRQEMAELHGYLHPETTQQPVARQPAPGQAPIRR